MTGDQMREARHALGLSQTEMAIALGYKRAATISDQELGKAPVPTLVEWAIIGMLKKGGL